MHLLIWNFMSVHLQKSKQLYEDHTFGFDLETDDLYKRVYIGDAKKKSSAPSIYKSKKVSEIILRVRTSLISMMFLSFPSLMLLSNSSY